MKNKEKTCCIPKKILQIGIPILIALVIGGIWLVKNGVIISTEQSKQTKEATATKVQSSNSNQSSAVGGNPDFALETLSLDLEKLKSYGIPIMIDFGADSYLPCKEMAPVLQELNNVYQGKVIIKFVDVWKNQSLAEGFPVEVIPTQFFFDKDGKPYVPSNPENSAMILYSLRTNNEHIYTAHQGGMTKDMILAVFTELGVTQ